MTWEQFGPIGVLERLEMSRSVTDVAEHQRSPRLPASLAKLNFGKALTHRHSCFVFCLDVYSALDSTSFRFSLMGN